MHRRTAVRRTAEAAIPRPHPKTDPSLAAQTLRSMYDHLVRVYGPQHWWPAKTQIEVIVGAYLTQNTSWRGVERSIANLEARGVLTLEGLRLLPEEELRALIRPSGYMLRKAAAIRAFVLFVDTYYAGELDRLSTESTATLRPQLLALPGVGPETADAILLYAFGHPVMVVDEYLRRITARHGLAPERARYAELQQLASAAFADLPTVMLLGHTNEFHALVVAVGKTHCGPRPRCQGCPLAGFPAMLPAPNLAH